MTGAVNFISGGLQIQIKHRKENTMELLKLGVKKHPFAMIFAVWIYVFMMLGRFQIDAVTTINYVSPVIFAVLFVLGDTLYMKRVGAGDEQIKGELVQTALGAVTVTAYMMIMLWVFSIVPSMKMFTGRNSAVPFFFGLAGLAGIAVYFSIKKKWSVLRLTVFIFAAAFVFHIYYIMYSGISYQWDQGQILGKGHGHLGYIEYIHDHMFLPQFDPREKWQYYHPPLNHIVQAFFMKAQTVAGVNIRIAVYNTTYLPLLYLMLTLVFFFRISEQMGLEKKYGNLVLTVCACSPAFFYIGSYVNNDMLSILLMMASLYFSLKWYKDKKISTVLKAALCFGLGMFTKMSVWMSAVPIAVIFIAALAKDIKAKKKRAAGVWFGQMAAFLAVAAPLSFYWSIRNYVRFGMPIGYIPVNQDDTQIITQDVLTRLFDFDPAQLTMPCVAFLRSGDSYNEYNPLIALIKSSSCAMRLPGYINYPLLAATILVCILSFICMAAVIAGRNTVKPLYKIMLASFYAVLMISYYVFCLKYPHVCTEEIRYASPVIFIGAFFMAYSLSLTAKSKKFSSLGRVIVSSALVFCALSLIMITYGGILSSFFYDFT